MGRFRVVVLVVLAWCGVASAQSSRPGMRLTVTRVAPTGGYTANGFLVVHTTTVTRTPAPECGAGAVRIAAEGHATGSIRAARVVAIAWTDERAVALGGGACDATIVVTLDDGSTLSPGVGTLHARLVGTGGLDATLSSTATDGAGVPITVSGHIVLSPAT